MEVIMYLRTTFNQIFYRLNPILCFSLSIVLVLFWANISFAQEPDDGLFFTASTYDTIQSRQVSLTTLYFQSQGELTNLDVVANSLAVSAGATQGTYTSEPIQSPLGITTDIIPTWKASSDNVKVEIRTSDNGSVWQEWIESPVTFNPISDSDYSGSMVWLGNEGQVHIQIRLTLMGDTTLDELTLIFNDTSQGPTNDDLPAANAAALNVCPAEKPSIISRTEWGSPDGQNSPRWAPYETDVTHVIIAHTVTKNSPTTDWPTVVRSVWNYHTNVLGWGDIGYNYLIDPEGKIYEGRAGSQNGEKDIIGRHIPNNRNSLGLAFIGCYGNCLEYGISNVQPRQIMMNKGVELISWKLGQNGLDSQEIANYHGKNIYRVSGARDVTNTYSPGSIIYNTWMPWLRQAVSDRVNCDGANQCQVTDIIFDKSEYNLNDTINFVVVVADINGVPLGGASVTADVSVETSTATLGYFDLENQKGRYQGVFRDTTVSGKHTFKVNATHDTFGTCTNITKSVNVVIDGTVPTPTPVDSYNTDTCGYNTDTCGYNTDTCGYNTDTCGYNTDTCESNTYCW